MSEFDVSHPRWVRPEYAIEKIQNGWIGQYASSGLISGLIRKGTQSVHSHSAMFRRNKNGHTTVDVLEVREFKGGQNRPLEYHLSLPARIDVFSTCRHGIYRDKFDPDGAVRAMRLLTQCEYGWTGIFQMACRRIPFTWDFFPPVTCDTIPNEGDPCDIRQPFCSHAVATATQVGGGVDVVPRLPNWLVSPGHLTTSMFYEYEFSLVNPWSVDHYGEHITELAELHERLDSPIA